MMNSNPETVSTDYDTSSRLYFEPLTVEDVLNVVEAERPEGIIVQFGGQTPLSLAGALQQELTSNPIPAASGAPPALRNLGARRPPTENAAPWCKLTSTPLLAALCAPAPLHALSGLGSGTTRPGAQPCCMRCAGNGNVRIWGTQPENIEQSEDRDQWYELLTRLDIKQPPGAMVTSEGDALQVAERLGYPVMVRPSFVLGGRAMEIVYGCAALCTVLPCTPVLRSRSHHGLAAHWSGAALCWPGAVWCLLMHALPCPAPPSR